MPKNTSDPSDPMELVGVALPTSSDALDEMGRTFAEEYLRMGNSPEYVLGLFEDPFYRGPNQVYTVRGAQAVRAMIEEVARKWGRRAEHRIGAGTSRGEQEVAR